ncbi:hypothetical protein [Terrisporobacter petrolearius]|uniref:hypothetical protein n=1 Tax=Terrisporobacter petrolearius TaxID=1460447 RepID=UPI0031CCCA06
MELCYLWIEKYKGFEDVEINFSSEFNFYKDGNLIKVTKNEERTIEKFLGITLLI